MSNAIPQVSLGELLTLERRPIKVLPDQQYAEIGIYSFGRGIFHKHPRSGLEVGEKDLFLIKEGDFILQITFAWEGAVGLASQIEDGMYGSVRFPTFRVDERRCYPPYLVNYFRTHAGREQLVGISPGSAGRNRVLSMPRIPEIYAPLPPLAEQHRIVARIEELAAKIEEARGLRREAVEEAEAFFTTSITDAFRGIHVKGHLGDVLRAKPRNGWSARCDNLDGGIPVLTLSAVTGFQYREDTFKRTSEPTSLDAHYWLQEGDLLITRSNTPELVGHVAIYNGKPNPCIYPDLIMKLVVNCELADRNFVHVWLQSSIAREFIRRSAKGTSPTMKKISQEVVMSIPFPSHLSPAEQRHIVAYLDSLQAKVDALRVLQSETQAELNALLPSVLDKAFKGEL
jgi:type I restriction enzyme, S subunit